MPVRLGNATKNHENQVGKPGKEVELEENQVPPRRLAQLVLCSETAMEWTKEHRPTPLLFGLEWLRKVG
jgi:hypothetical protein